MVQATESRPAASDQNSLDERVARSKREWALLQARVQSITPTSLGRGLLAAASAFTVAWLALSTWPTLLPFAVGGAVAYAVFPLVGRLEKVMPRFLASLVATAIGFGTVALVVAIVVPPLVQQGVALVTRLPESQDLARVRSQLDAYLATLPETTRFLAQGVVDRIGAQLRGNVSGLQDLIAVLTVQTITHIFGTVGSLLGMIVLPIWVLYVVRDGDRVTSLLTGQFSPSVRPDAAALIAIVNRAMGTFVRMQLTAAVLTAAGVLLGMTAFERLGIARYNSEVAVAALAGTVQVVPQIGWLLGLAPAAIALATRPQEPSIALSYVLLYAAVLRGVYLLVGRRMGRILSIRSSVAIPGVVLLSGLGVGWLLLSAPLLVIARDTFLYVHGRLAEPPAPAGVLPGTRQAARRPAVLEAPAAYAGLAAARSGARGRSSPPVWLSRGRGEKA